MALLVHVKKGGKLLVNGAVLENASGRTMSVLLRNEAIVLRGEEILPQSAAATPATRLYYSLQCAYLFPDDRPRYVALASTFLDAYEEAAPSASAIVGEVRTFLRGDNLYAALKPGKALIQHESRMLAGVCGRNGAADETRPARPARVGHPVVKSFETTERRVRAFGGA